MPGCGILLSWQPSLPPGGLSPSSMGAGGSEAQAQTVPTSELGLVAMSSEGVDTDSKP